VEGATLAQQIGSSQITIAKPVVPRFEIRLQVSFFRNFPRTQFIKTSNQVRGARGSTEPE